MRVAIQWDRTERRENYIEVPEDTPSEDITDLAVREASRGRAGQLDTVVSAATGLVTWQAPDGRFGGRAS